MTASSPIRFLDVAHMAATDPPRVPWLAPPLLPRATLTALYAPGGDGKSLLSMALAAALAHGAELAGIECETATTVYLDAENGEWEIHRRVHTLGLPASGVQVADAGGLDLRGDMAVIEAVLRDMTPDLLILDSLRSMTPGMDENDTRQTAAVLDPLRRLAHESGAAILLIHHANKAGKDFRGASSIRDSVDVLWHLGRQDDDPDPRRRFLSCRKMRVAGEPDRLWLRLEVDRGRVLIDRAEPPEEQAPPITQPIRAQLSDEIIAAMDGRPMRLAAVAELVGRRPKDGSVRNALAALVADGQLARQGNDYLKVQTVQPTVCTFAPGRETGCKVQTPLRALHLCTRQRARSTLTPSLPASRGSSSTETRSTSLHRRNPTAPANASASRRYLTGIGARSAAGWSRERLEARNTSARIERRASLRQSRRLVGHLARAHRS